MGGAHEGSLVEHAMTEQLNPVALAERVIALFAEAKFGATYKHAVMLGLMDLAFEKTSHTGVAPSSVLVASIRWPTRWSALRIEHIFFVAPIRRA